MKDLRIEKKRKQYPFDSNFVTGNFYNRGAEYRFQAKVFPEESHWGINCGHVSKLWVKNLKLDKEVFNYDRGFDIGNESMVEKGMIKDLVDFLEVYSVEIMEKLYTDPSYFNDWK